MPTNQEIVDHARNNGLFKTTWHDPLNRPRWPAGMPLEYLSDDRRSLKVTVLTHVICSLAARIEELERKMEEHGSKN